MRVIHRSGVDSTVCPWTLPQNMSERDLGNGYRQHGATDRQQG